MGACPTGVCDDCRSYGPAIHDQQRETYGSHRSLPQRVLNQTRPGVGILKTDMTGQELRRSFPNPDRSRVAQALAEGARQSLRAASRKAKFFSQADVVKTTTRAIRLLSPRSLQAHGSSAVVQARGTVQAAKASAIDKSAFDSALTQIDGVEQELAGLGR